MKKEIRIMVTNYDENTAIETGDVNSGYYYYTIMAKVSDRPASTATFQIEVPRTTGPEKFRKFPHKVNVTIATGTVFGAQRVFALSPVSGCGARVHPEDLKIMQRCI